MNAITINSIKELDIDEKFNLFVEQNEPKNFNCDSIESCIERGIFLVKKLEAQYLFDGIKTIFNSDEKQLTNVFKNAILNRNNEESYMSAIIRSVEKIEFQQESFVC